MADDRKRLREELRKRFCTSQSLGGTAVPPFALHSITATLDGLTLQTAVGSAGKMHVTSLLSTPNIAEAMAILVSNN